MFVHQILAWTRATVLWQAQARTDAHVHNRIREAFASRSSTSANLDRAWTAALAQLKWAHHTTRAHVKQASMVRTATAVSIFQFFILTDYISKELIYILILFLNIEEYFSFNTTGTYGDKYYCGTYYQCAVGEWSFFSFYFQSYLVKTVSFINFFYQVNGAMTQTTKTCLKLSGIQYVFDTVQVKCVRPPSSNSVPNCI